MSKKIRRLAVKQKKRRKIVSRLKRFFGITTSYITPHWKVLMQAKKRKKNRRRNKIARTSRKKNR